MDNHRSTITIDCRMIKASGIGRYLQELFSILFQNLNCNFVLLGSSEDLDIYAQNHANVNIVNFTFPIYSIKEQIYYPKNIPTCDLFWSPHFNIPLLPIKAKKRLVTIHDAYHLAFKKELSLKERIYADLVYRAALNRSDKIITVSDFSKSELIKHTSFKHPNKIEVVHNGINKISEVSDATKPSYTYQFLLYVGNVKPHKNLKSALLGYADYIKKKCSKNNR